MNVRRKKAFTIIELIVVIAVIGILVLLAMPKFLGYVERSKVTVIRHDVKVAEDKLAEVLLHGDQEFLRWDSNAKDLDDLVGKRKLYDIRGLVIDGVEYNKDTEDFRNYKIIPLNVRKNIGTKLTGDFYANVGGKVYYEREKAAKLDPANGDGVQANGCPVDIYTGYIPVDMDEEFDSKVQHVYGPEDEMTFREYIDMAFGNDENSKLNLSGFKKDNNYFLLIETMDVKFEDNGDFYEINKKIFMNAANVGDLFTMGPDNPNIDKNNFNGLLQIRKNGVILSTDEIKNHFGNKFEGTNEPIGNLAFPKYIPTYNIDRTILSCSVSTSYTGEEDKPLECGLMIQFDLDLNTLISVPIADSSPEDEGFYTVTLKEFIEQSRLPDGAIVANYKFNGETYLYIQTKEIISSWEYEESVLVVKPQDFHKFVMGWLDDEEYYEYRYEENDGDREEAYGNIGLLPKCITQMDENGKIVGKTSLVKFRGNTTPDVINTSCSMNMIEFTSEMVDFAKKENDEYWNTINVFEHKGKEYIAFLNIKHDYTHIEEIKSTDYSESAIEYEVNTEYFSFRDINEMTIYNWSDKEYVVSRWSSQYGNWNEDIPLPTCYKYITIIEPDLGKIVSYLNGTTLYVLRELSKEVNNYSLTESQLWKDIDWNPSTPSDGKMKDFSFGWDNTNQEALEKVTKLVIGDNIIHIGKESFKDGKSIKELELGKDVVTIGEYAFAWMDLGTLIIPDSVITIGENAFPGNKITKITFGKNTKVIGGGAFSDHQFTEIVIPDSVTEIGYYAFDASSSDSINLVSLKIGNSVARIGEYAFKGNKLESIIIGNDVNIIDKAFIEGLKLNAGLEFSASYTKEHKSAGKYLFTPSGWYKEGNPIPEQINPPAPGYIPIANAEELNNIRKNETNLFGAGTEYEGNYLGGLDKKYMQVADIDLINYQSGLGWEPIGLRDNPFTGHYIAKKGENSKYKIINLKVNRNTNEEKGIDVGLFGEISGGKIENLELVNVNVVGLTNVGSLAGAVKRSSSVTGVTSTGYVEGGLIIGGLMGYTDASPTYNSSFSGSVIGNRSPGTGYYLGGLIGSSNSTVSRCFAKADVSGYGDYVGGLIGDSRSTVSDSYAIGIAAGKNSSNVGGLIGLNSSNGKVSNSYASVEVSGQKWNYKYGVFGTNTNSLKNENTYFDTGKGNTAGGPYGSGTAFVAKTTSQLKSGDELPGFNAKSWPINWVFENGQYPRLIWE